MHPIRSIPVLLTAVLCCAAVAGDLPGGSGLEKLSVYNGSFELKTTYFKTAYSEAKTEDEVVKTQCSSSPGYYVCNQTDKTGMSKLIVYTYDAKQDEYYAYFISDNPEHLTSGMRLKTSGATWIYSAKLKDPKGKQVYLRDINVFNGPDNIDFEEDYSDDGQQWIVMSKAKETRVPNPTS